jgi:hypothetical protein
VLLAGTEAEASVLGELACGLRRFGHTASIALSTEEALGQATPEVLIASEAAGSSLFMAFNLPTGGPRCIFLSTSRDFDTAVVATRHGADEVLGMPTIDELAAAVERNPRVQTLKPSRELELSSMPDNASRSLRELLAFTTRLGLGRGLRLRIATAASELFHHAEGPTTLTAGLAADPVGVDRLVLELTDFGGGLGKHNGGQESPSSLDFVCALSERLDVTFAAESTHARAEFVLAPLHFEEDPAGMDELDYFDPCCLRELHAVLGDAAESHGRDLHHLAPAAAPALARIATAGARPETALFPASAESSIES